MESTYSDSPFIDTLSLGKFQLVIFVNLFKCLNPLCRDQCWTASHLPLVVKHIADVQS